jgi:hypothetical protein
MVFEVDDPAPVGVLAAVAEASTAIVALAEADPAAALPENVSTGVAVSEGVATFAPSTAARRASNVRM